MKELSEKEIELFDAFHRNQLSDVDKQNLQLRIENDSEFANKYLLYCTIAQGVVAFEKNQLKNYLQANVPKGKVRNINWQKPLLIAATFLILLGIAYLFKDKLLNQHKTELVIKDNTIIADTLLGKDDEINELANHTKDAPVIEPKANTEDKSIKFNEITAAEKEMATITNDAEIAMEPQSSYPVPPPALQKENDEVLVEKLLFDTILNVYAIEISMADVALETQTSTKKTGNLAVRKSTKGYAESKAKDTAQLETMMKYKVESWVSPIGYKGYSKNKEHIKLYGILHSFNLRMINNHLYLISDNNAYELKECTESCSFNLITDKKLLTILLQE